MITTVTLNPMLDKTIHVAAIRRGEIVRASRMEMIVGGKGVNVARQVHAFGLRTCATGFAGGEVGSLLERLLDQEGIPHRFTHIAAMTREGLSFVDDAGVMTSVFEPPAEPVPEEVEQLHQLCESMIPASAWVVCSGSSPARCADGVFARLLRAATVAGVRSVLDAYGSVFRVAVEAGPTVAKMNCDEFASTYGKRLATETDRAEALKELARHGSRWCMLTDGAKPWYALVDGDLWRVTPPVLTPVNPTGSGDSMVGGLLYALAQSMNVSDALALACAAGAANAVTLRVSSGTLNEVSPWAASVRPERIATSIQ